MPTLNLPHPLALTPEALEGLPDDFRYEVREGNLVVMSAAMRPWHADVQARLRNVLVARGHHAFIEQGIILSDDELRTCDVGVLRQPPTDDRAYRPGEDYELVVEVVSPASQREDREVKPRLYAAAGITQYWRVEQVPHGAEVLRHVLEPGADSYTLRDVVSLVELEDGEA